MLPIDERLVTEFFEILAGFEMTLVLEVVAKLGMNGYEFQQQDYASKAVHRLLSPSKMEM